MMSCDLTAESTLHAELSPGPRSDSVTPTNELADEESLTPKSVSAREPGTED